MLTTKAPGMAGASIHFPAGAHFKTADVVGREQRQVAVVGVGTRPDPLLAAARGRRVVQQAQRRHRAVEFFGEIIGRDAKVVREGAMNAGAERGGGAEIGEQHLAESGQVRPGVERPERLAGEKLGIVRLEVEADIEGLLHVRPLLRIERLMQEAGIAAVAADLLDRDCLLFGEGQREERLRLRESRVHQIAADAVIDGSRGPPYHPARCGHFR